HRPLPARLEQRLGPRGRRGARRLPPAGRGRRARDPCLDAGPRRLVTISPRKRIGYEVWSRAAVGRRRPRLVVGPARRRHGYLLDPRPRTSRLHLHTITAPRHGTPPTAAPTWRWTQVEAPRMPRELASSLYARFAGHCFARAHLLAGDVGVAHPVLDELAPPTQRCGPPVDASRGSRASSMCWRGTTPRRLWRRS